MDDSTRDELITQTTNRVVSALDSRLNRIEDELKKVVRRQDTQQKSLDILDKDRMIWEDATVILRSIQELLKQTREHQQTVNQDFKSELSEVKEDVKNTPDAVKDAVADNIGQLITAVEKKKTFLHTPSFIDKILHRK